MGSRRAKSMTNPSLSDNHLTCRERTGMSRSSQIQSRRQWRLIPVAHLSRSTAMRALLPVVCFVLGGCALLFTEGEAEIGVIPRLPASNVVVRTALRRDTRAIRFTCDAF